MDLFYDKCVDVIDNDDLGRESLVNLIVQSIIAQTKNNNQKSLTYGIYGEWGEGKTSLMNMVSGELVKSKSVTQNQSKSQEKVSRIETFWYNPWSSSDFYQMLVDFFSSFSKILYGKDQSELIGNYVNRILLKNIYSSLEETAQTEKISHYLEVTGEDITSLKDSISQKLCDDNVHIVVFIDDVDRLLPNEIQALFKLTRHLADFNNVIYVMGFDPTVVSLVLDKTYNSKDLGRSYMSKMIQIPIVLPIIQDERLKAHIEKYLKSLIESCEMSKHITDDRLKNVSVTLSKVLTTERSIKRYINQMNFVFPILKMDTEFEDLCLLEALKFLDEQGWLEIYHQKNSLLGIASVYDEVVLNDKKNEAIKAIVALYPEKWSLIVQEIIEKYLFPIFAKSPRFRNVRFRKVNNHLFFSQYFLSEHPYGIIPGSDVRELMDVGENKNIKCVKDWINKETEKYNNEQVERSVLSALEYINVEKGNEKVRPVAARMCKALAVSKLTKNYSFLSYENTNTVDQTMGIYIIQDFIIQRKLSTQSRADVKHVYDVVFDVVRYIFKNADTIFCMNLINTMIDYRDVISKDSFEILQTRLKGNLRYYSYDIQLSYLYVWKGIDHTKYLDFMKDYFFQSKIKAEDTLKNIVDSLPVDDNRTKRLNLILELLEPLKNELISYLDSKKLLDDSRLSIIITPMTKTKGLKIDPDIK